MQPPRHGVAKTVLALLIPIKPPRGRAGLAPRGPARRALVGFRTEAVVAALLRLAGTCRLILLRRDPRAASGLRSGLLR